MRSWLGAVMERIARKGWSGSNGSSDQVGIAMLADAKPGMICQQRRHVTRARVFCLNGKTNLRGPGPWWKLTVGIRPEMIWGTTESGLWSS